MEKPNHQKRRKKEMREEMQACQMPLGFSIFLSHAQISLSTSESPLKQLNPTLKL